MDVINQFQHQQAEDFLVLLLTLPPPLLGRFRTLALLLLPREAPFRFTLIPELLLLRLLRSILQPRSFLPLRR